MENIKNKGLISRKGFTLIELLIVIGIITILASAVIIAINPGVHFQRAREATRMSHANSIVTAVYSYAVDHEGNLPECNDTTGSPLSDGTETDWDNERDISNCTEELSDGVNEADIIYLPELPQDPQDGKSYQISSNTDGTRIQITTTADESDLEVTQ